MSWGFAYFIVSLERRTFWCIIFEGMRTVSASCSTVSPVLALWTSRGLTRLNSACAQWVRKTSFNWVCNCSPHSQTHWSLCSFTLWIQLTLGLMGSPSATPPPPHYHAAPHPQQIWVSTGLGNWSLWVLWTHPAVGWTETALRRQLLGCPMQAEREMKKPCCC